MWKKEKKSETGKLSGRGWLFFHFLDGSFSDSSQQTLGLV